MATLASAHYDLCCDSVFIKVASPSREPSIEEERDFLSETLLAFSILLSPLD